MPPTRQHKIDAFASTLNLLIDEHRLIDRLVTNALVGQPLDLVLIHKLANSIQECDTAIADLKRMLSPEGNEHA